MPAALTMASAPALHGTAGMRHSSFRGNSVKAPRPSLARRASRMQAVQTVARTTTKQAYICLDCGYIYDGKEAFESLPSSYRCPVCNAPKRRFGPYEGPRGKNDSKSMLSRMQTIRGGKGSKRTAAPVNTGVDKDDKSFLLILAAAGAVVLGAVYFAVNSQF